MYRVEVDWCGVTQVWEAVAGTLTEEVDFFGATSIEPRTFAMSETFDRVSLAAQHAAGASLESAVGRVYLDGTLMLSGRLRRPQWRYDEEPVRFSIVESTWGGRQWPSAAPERPDLSSAFRAITASIQGAFRGFPGVSYGGSLEPAGSDQEVGAYPEVFGRPDGSPAYRVLIDATAYWVIAAHQVADSAVIVRRKDDDGVVSALSAPVVYVEDTDGRMVAAVAESTIDIDSGTVGIQTPNPEDKLFVQWGASGGGRSGLLGDVLRHLLRYIPQRVDEERLGAYHAQLQRYRVDTYFASPEDIEEVVRDILEPFPACLVHGRAGIYVWVWDPDATPVGHLVVTTDAELTDVHAGDIIEGGDSPPLLSYQLQYGIQESTESYTSITSTRGAQYVQARGQVDGAVEVVEATHIRDAATAQRCADLRMMAMGRTPIVVPLVLERDRWGHLRAGDTVALTWARVGLVARTGVVTRIEDPGVDVLAVRITIPILPGRTP